MTFMPDESWHEEAAKQARSLQIIVTALLMGGVVFLLIVLGIGPKVIQPVPLQRSPATWVACVAAGIALIAKAVVAWRIAKKARREIVNGTYTPIHSQQQVVPSPTGGGPSSAENARLRDATYLQSFFQSMTIVGLVLLEAAAVIATRAYFIEGHPVALGLAILMLVSVAAQFPTQSQIIGWVERQIEAAEQEKMLRFPDRK